MQESLPSAGVPIREASLYEVKAYELTRYHAATEDEIRAMGLVRKATKDLIEIIMMTCPPSADRSSAVRQARMALMWANCSIIIPSTISSV